MDVFIKVEECGGDDFGGSPVTSTVLSPLGGGHPTPHQRHPHPQDTDQSLVDLGIDISSDFGMTSLFDDKKTFFDPAAPMAEPVTSFQHINSSPVKKEYSYDVTAVPPAVVVTSSGGNDVGCYLTSPVTTVPSPASTADLMGASPPSPFFANGGGGGLNSPGITILYEQKNIETSTRQTMSTSTPRKYLSGKGANKTNITSEQSFAAADSNSESPSRPYVPCKVCGDKASGYHYGVTSCEGCKGFFRRSIQKQIEYRCLRDGKCLVIRLNRNRCQHCRFKKCLAVGMSRDSVRYGRVPKRSRERQAAEESRGNVVVSEADQSAWEGNEAKEKHLTQIIRIISDIYRMFCAYTEDKVQNIVRKPAIFSLDEFQNGSIDASGNTQISADSLEQQKIVMWQHFAIMLTPSIQRIVEMAKRVPGFQDLTQDDQIILIKQGFFEIWMIHISKLVSSQDNTITFSDGSYITRQQVELMFDYEFVSALFNFVTAFNNMQLDDTEIALFSAIVLLMSERPGIYDHKTIDQQQEKIMEALKYQLSLNHAANPHMFATLMIKLPELRALGAKHMEHLEWFRANWTQLKLPPLFAETFDIPNREQILQQ